MTDQLELTELDDQGAHIADDGVRRDWRGGYLCRPPGETKLVGHRRMTTVLKALDSEGGLLPWHGGRVALGMLRDPALLARARKLTRRGEHDAWYASPGDKAAFKKLLGEAADAGGRHVRADLGTFLHGVAERWLRDGEMPDDPAARAWLEHYIAALTTAGIVIDPNYLETIVVRDHDRIAGKVDYLRVTVPGYELPMIGDLKTGDSLDYSLSGYVIQLAGYRFANAIYVQGADPNGADDERLELPELDAKHGLIIHAPAGGEPVTFHVVDLLAGAAALELALAVEAWRKRDDLAIQLDNGELTAQLQASIDRATKSVAGRTGVARPPAEGRQAPQDEAGATVHHLDERRLSSEPQEATAAELRPWLQGRIDAIGRHEAARADLVRLWPAGMPTLKRSEEHTDEQLQQIERLCDAIEARRSLPFGETRPGAVAAVLRWVTTAFPGSTVEAEPNSPTQGATDHE
jgi:hypothetical protein